MRTLAMWETYSREEVHGIFSPDTRFTPQSGTWGLQGIVKIPNRPGSYVFFVTFGKSQGSHDFDESVTTDGVLTWQSQPKQQLSDPTIVDFINHDDRQRTIHLFLRTRADVAYTYCGTLGYLTHDDEREMPVHFQWQLLDWPAPRSVVDGMGLVLIPDASDGLGPTRPDSPRAANHLMELPPPAGSSPGATRTRRFRAVKAAMHPDRDAHNRALGLAGEHLVLRSEIERLRAAGRSDLADRAVHVSVVEGDGAGYDIRSFADDGSERHLEVKTTRSSALAAFIVSPNEVAFSDEHPDSFELVRVYDFDRETQSGCCYRLRGSLSEHVRLVPSEYRAALKA